MLSEAAAALGRARRVLVASHLGPDVDAAGSMLAVAGMLDTLGIERHLLLEDGVPYEAAALPGADEIARAVSGEFDLAVILDCPVPTRIGKAVGALGPAIVVNIDHHVTNTRFGHVNVVDSSMASTSQIVLRLAAALGQPLSERAATYVLTGLVGDTQGFRTSNTNLAAIKDAQTLVEAGADIVLAGRRVFGERPRGHVLLWGRALAAATLSDGLAWASIPLALRRQTGLPDDDDAGIVNFLIGTQGTRAAAVFSEQADGTVDVNLRSIPGMDVAAVALEFGGGGHRQAAGCTVAGTLESARQKVLDRLRQVAGDDTARPAAAR